MYIDRIVLPLLLWLAIVMQLSGERANAAEPKVFGVAPGALQTARTRIASGDKSAQAALDKLVSDAKAALKVKPPSVTDKTKNPGSSSQLRG